MPFGIKEAKTKQTTLPVSNGERAALIKLSTRNKEHKFTLARLTC